MINFSYEFAGGATPCINCAFGGEVCYSYSPAGLDICGVVAIIMIIIIIIIIIASAFDAATHFGTFSQRSSTSTREYDFLLVIYSGATFVSSYKLSKSANRNSQKTTISDVTKLCSVLFFCRPRSEGWLHHLSLSSVILTDSSTEIPVHVLMLSIQAVHAWPSSPVCTWHCSLHYLFLEATPLFPHGVTVC